MCNTETFVSISAGGYILFPVGGRFHIVVFILTVGCVCVCFGEGAILKSHFEKKRVIKLTAPIYLVSLTVEEQIEAIFNFIRYAMIHFTSHFDGLLVPLAGQKHTHTDSIRGSTCVSDQCVWPLTDW